jgi:CO dehydrogenase/acetyl-CoA synthase alpha subunit
MPGAGRAELHAKGNQMQNDGGKPPFEVPPSLFSTLFGSKPPTIEELERAAKYLELFDAGPVNDWTN